MRSESHSEHGAEHGRSTAATRFHRVYGAAGIAPSIQNILVHQIRTVWKIADKKNTSLVLRERVE